VTRNHEYHCLDGICIAVRDAATGAFLQKHAALGKPVTAALRFGAGGVESVSPPENARPGERIRFASGIHDPHDVLTSSLKSVDRPTPEVIALYDSR
jgi:hypothetical protein